MVTRTTQAPGPELDPDDTDLAPGLADLAGQADQLDQPAPGAPGAPPAPGQAPAMTNAQIIAAALDMIRETTCIVAGVKSLQVTASPDKLAPVAQAWGDVADKRGLILADMVGDYMAELKAVVITVAVVREIGAALRQEMAEKRPPKAEPKDITPGPNGIDPGPL